MLPALGVAPESPARGVERGGDTSPWRGEALEGVAAVAAVLVVLASAELGRSFTLRGGSLLGGLAGAALPPFECAPAW